MRPEPLSPEVIKRRIALKHMGHATLGGLTTFVITTGSYQKPTLKKMLNLPMAAAEAASFGDDVTPP